MTTKPYSYPNPSQVVTGGRSHVLQGTWSLGEYQRLSVLSLRSYWAVLMGLGKSGVSISSTASSLRRLELERAARQAHAAIADIRLLIKQMRSWFEDEFRKLHRWH